MSIFFLSRKFLLLIIPHKDYFHLFSWHQQSWLSWFFLAHFPQLKTTIPLTKIWKYYIWHILKSFCNHVINGFLIMSPFFENETVVPKFLVVRDIHSCFFQQSTCSGNIILLDFEICIFYPEFLRIFVYLQCLVKYLASFGDIVFKN